MYLVVIRFSDPGAGQDAARALADASGLDPRDVPVVVSPSGTQIVAFVTDDRLDFVRREVLRRGGDVVYEERRDAREWRRFRHDLAGSVESSTVEDAERVQRLARNSDALLDAVERIRDTEQQKRTEGIASPRFDELARDVERLASEIAGRARAQRTDAHGLDRSDQSIEDVRERDQD